MPSPHPTIVLVHGALHDDTYFTPLKASLKARSYPSVSGPLPSVNTPTPKTTTLSTDVDYVRSKLILPLLHAGKDVIVVMHSYGGVVGGSAVQGLSKTERKNEGKEGGVVGMVWMVAFMIPVGSSVLDTIGGSWGPTINDNKEEMTMSAIDLSESLYNDMSASESVAWNKLLLPQSRGPAMSKVQYTPFTDPAYKNRCAYLMCTNDKTVSFPVQQQFVEDAGIEITETLEAGHMVVGTMPEETATFLVRAAGEFRKV